MSEGRLFPGVVRKNDRENAQAWVPVAGKFLISAGPLTITTKEEAVQREVELPVGKLGRLRGQPATVGWTVTKERGCSKFPSVVYWRDSEAARPGCHVQ